MFAVKWQIIFLVFLVGKTRSERIKRDKNNVEINTLKDELIVSSIRWYEYVVSLNEGRITKTVLNMKLEGIAQEENQDKDGKI
jgi:hypothetical protein